MHDETILQTHLKESKIIYCLQFWDTKLKAVLKFRGASTEHNSTGVHVHSFIHEPISVDAHHALRNKFVVSKYLWLVAASFHSLMEPQYKTVINAFPSNPH